MLNKIKGQFYSFHLAVIFILHIPPAGGGVCIGGDPQMVIKIEDNHDGNNKFRITELILVVPYGNLKFSFIGSVKEVLIDKDTIYYFGYVEIDQDIICCLCEDKVTVAKHLELIYLLKYYDTAFRKRYRIYKTSFDQLILN